MRTILFMWGDKPVLSHPAILLFALFLGLGSLAWRSQKRPVNHIFLLKMCIVGLISGWLGGRLLKVVLTDQLGEVGWKVLLPWQYVPVSATLFAYAAVPLVIVGLFFDRQNFLSHVDVIAPSAIHTFAFAKLACMMASCCMGIEASPPIGMSFPFGSGIYRQQWMQEQVNPPSALLIQPPEGEPRLLGNAQIIRYLSVHNPSALQEHVDRHDVSIDQILSVIDSERSLPVIPLPLYYSVLLLVAWWVAEWLYTRATPGMTAAFCCICYGILRLSLDFLMPNPSGSVLHVSQYLALASILIGIALLLQPIRSHITMNSTSLTD